MRRRWWITIVVLVVLAGGGALFRARQASPEDAGYRFATIERGDLESTVSSTGTLEPVGTVEVGTQVSGTIAKVHADFNDRVRSGQLLAVLDTLLLRASVLETQAEVARQQALLEEAQRDLAQKRPLYERGLLAESEWLPVEIAVRTQEAALHSALAGQERARANLDYAFIRSPIDGTVIHRGVEAGQTVAASLSTPTLFIIAEDLARMEIHAAVDESDIGSIAVGQNVRFEVPAYPDQSFTGSVRQIRLQPTTVQNVVSYTVVVDAENPGDLLLPGMTASLDFLVQERRDVLMVRSSAVNLRPSEQMLTALRARHSAEGPPTAHEGQSGAKHLADAAVLWVLDEKGELRVAHVRTGLSDGQSTELLNAGGLEEGARVIAGLGSQAAASTHDESRPAFGGPMMGPPPGRPL